MHFHLSLGAKSVSAEPYLDLFEAAQHLGIEVIDLLIKAIFDLLPYHVLRADGSAALRFRASDLDRWKLEKAHPTSPKGSEQL